VGSVSLSDKYIPATFRALTSSWIQWLKFTTETANIRHWYFSNIVGAGLRDIPRRTQGNARLQDQWFSTYCCNHSSFEKSCSSIFLAL